MPTTLLLDFGSVITFSVFEIMDLAEQRLGLPPGTLPWRGPLDPAKDRLWRDMQADRITEREYWEKRAREVGALLGKSWLPLDFFRAVRGTNINDDVRPDMLALARDARAAGLTTGILSNELELFAGAEAIAGLEILRLMDVTIDATHTGILKPDFRAYTLAVQATASCAQDILFVDDQHRNVLGAQRAGLRAVQFRIDDPAGSITEIRTLLGIGSAKQHS
jgi:putative hydrolase of the HAD superfamily